METIHIQSEKDRVVITIDKNSENEELLRWLLRTLRVEDLARRVNFDESIEALGEEIKAGWWAKNKHRFESLE
jgi:HSP20 family molecular chaperone IbpA